MSSGSEWFHIGNKQKDKALSPSPESQLQSIGIRSPLPIPPLGCSKASGFGRIVFFCVRRMGLSPRILARRGGWEVTRGAPPRSSKVLESSSALLAFTVFGLTACGFGFAFWLLHASATWRPTFGGSPGPQTSPCLCQAHLAGVLSREAELRRGGSKIARASSVARAAMYHDA